MRLGAPGCTLLAPTGAPMARAGGLGNCAADGAMVASAGAMAASAGAVAASACAQVAPASALLASAAALTASSGAMVPSSGLVLPTSPWWRPPVLSPLGATDGALVALAGAMMAWWRGCWRLSAGVERSALAGIPCPARKPAWESGNRKASS